MSLQKKRFFVSVNEMELILLNKLMQEDAKTNVSSYFGYLISEVAKRREQEDNSRPRLGRPPKDKSKHSIENPNDTDPVYLHPDQKTILHRGEMCTAAAVLNYYALRGAENEPIPPELLEKMKQNGHI